MRNTISLNLRVPPEIHKQMKAALKLQPHMSQNAFIINAIIAHMRGEASHG